MKHSGCIMAASLRHARAFAPGVNEERTAAGDIAPTQASIRSLVVVLDLAALRARVVIQLPFRGVERIAQRGVHVLLPRRAIHDEILSRDCKLDMHVIELALLLTMLRQPDRDPAAADFVMKTLELCHVVADMLFDRSGTLDAAENNLYGIDDGQPPLQCGLRRRDPGTIFKIARWSARVLMHVNRPVMTQAPTDATRVCI